MGKKDELELEIVDILGGIVLWINKQCSEEISGFFKGYIKEKLKSTKHLKKLYNF